MNLGYCVGQIKDDSDIAGTAAVLAVLINAVIPIVISPMLWAYIYFYLNRGNLGPANHHPGWINVARDMLIMRGEVRLVTSLSVIVAFLVNIYHDDETSHCTRACRQ